MLANIIEDNEYQNLVSNQINDIINILINKNIEFTIVANMLAIDFNPKLPSEIYKKLNKFPVFTLSNYTYSTIKVENNKISFEAGFGSDNFGSIVSIPLVSIFQIIVDESIIFINNIATVDSLNEHITKKSLNVFTRNPKNKDLLH